MDEFFKGLGIAVGVFVGVVGGTIVTLLVQAVNTKRLKSQRLRNLRFEFDLDIKKIDEWLDLLNNYRNAVNANTPDMFAGWFDLSRFVFVTANSMFATGELYEYLDHDDIGKLQVFYSDFSQYTEGYMNNQIAQHRANFVQAEAAKTIVFWERKWKGHRDTLQQILRKLP